MSGGTRLACGMLFVLAVCLAGAASSAVRGMSAPAAYNPYVLRLNEFEPGRASEVDGDLPPPPPKAVVAPRPAPKAKARGGVPPSKPAPPRPATKKAAADDAPPLKAAPEVEAPRFWIKDRKGRRVVARVYAESRGQVAVMMPSGEIGFVDGAAPTSEPFKPLTMDQLQNQLGGEDFGGFKIRRTKHYLVYYDGSERFAKASSDLLEDLYMKLSGALAKKGFSVHEAEFPLVAVIYGTEADFRARKRVPGEVQAYYEILTNRFFMYETASDEHQSPEVALLRKPQTVAHEGAHQLLQNIGVQPRLSDWPLWLVEGLAEYCSPPKMSRQGVEWAGLNQINPLHMATIRDLDDPLSTFVRGGNAESIRRNPNESWIGTLVSKSDLNPTDYALSWALTHYLANKRLTEFLDYLKDMSKRPPLEKRTGEDHLRDFEAAFGKVGLKSDAVVATYFARIKNFDVIPYYAVMFEQRLGEENVRRAAMVSQSPQMIQQWVQSMKHPRGGLVRWQATPHSTRARAIIAAQEWMR